MAHSYALTLLLSNLTVRNAAIVVILLPFFGFLVYEVVRWSARVPSFDGPRGWPIVGNLWQIRGKDAPEQYRVWSKKFGGLFQIQLGNIPVLVINTAAAAKVVLSQNSQATSSRPEFYTFHKVCPLSSLSPPSVVTLTRYLTLRSDHFRQHCGHDYRHHAVHRIPEKTQEGQRFGVEQTGSAELRSSPRRGDEGLLARDPGSGQEGKGHCQS